MRHECRDNAYFLTMNVFSHYLFVKGLLMSLTLESAEDNFVLYNIVAPVTSEEISFMQEFEIEDGDGWVDDKEFMILIAVRIGAISPVLLGRVNNRFRQLDRKGLGKIAYNDLIWGRKISLLRRSAQFRNYQDSTMSAQPCDLSESHAVSIANRNSNKTLFALRAKSIFAVSGAITDDEEITANIRKIQCLAQNNSSTKLSMKPFSSTSRKDSTQSQRTASLGTDSLFNSQYSNFCRHSDSESEKSIDEAGPDQHHHQYNAEKITTSSASEEIKVNGKDLEKCDGNKKANCAKVDLPKALVSQEENCGTEHAYNSTQTSATVEDPRIKQLNSRFSSFADSVCADNQFSMTGRKYGDKLQKVKQARRRSTREAYALSKKSFVARMLWKVKIHVRSSTANFLYLWLLWLAVGTIFLTIVEGLSISEGIFVSTSVGYGIFWYDLSTANAITRVFCILHFSVGVLGVALTMALFANNLTTTKKEWYSEAKEKRSIQTALTKEEWWHSIAAFIKFYWPKVYVHFFFVLWMLLGIVWGMASLQLKVLDAWLFCMTAMATGGLVSLPSSGVHARDYVFYSIFIAIGAPLMAISCGVLAHNISMYGKTAKMMSKIHTPMTEDELVMLRHLDLENGDGYIDRAEFVILVLVRIGALNPDMIGALFERFHEIDADGKGNVTYEALVNRQSFFGSLMGPKSFVSLLSRSFTRVNSIESTECKNAAVAAEGSGLCDNNKEVNNEREEDEV